MVKNSFAAAAIVFVCCAGITEARVTRIEVTKIERVDPKLPPHVADRQRPTLDLAVDRVAGDVRNAGGVGRRE